MNNFTFTHKRFTNSMKILSLIVLVALLGACERIVNRTEEVPTVANIFVTQSGTVAEGGTITLSLTGMSLVQVNSETQSLSNYNWTLVSPQQAPAGLRILSPSAAQTAVVLPFLSDFNTTVALEFRLTFSAGDRNYAVNKTLSLSSPSDIVDADGDGLIEIRNLTMLHNTRHSPGGEHSLPAGQVDYRTSESATTGLTRGCPSGACIGYELVRDLNFDSDGDGRTWTDNGDNTYTLDTGDSQAPYFVVDGGTSDAWVPVGTTGSEFSAIFDGNGFTIYNLAIIGDPVNGQDSVGLFGETADPSQIRNIHIVQALVTGNTAVGILVGGSNSSVVSSSVSGIVQGLGSGVGGLIGSILNTGYRVTGNYSTATVTAFTNAPRGQATNFAPLLGESRRGEDIQASYAAGDVRNTNNISVIGGLIGNIITRGVTASYATGNVQGLSAIGNLIGEGGEPSESYGFGTATTELGSVNSIGTDLPLVMPGGRPITISELTSENAGTTWNSAAEHTFGAWDFTRRAANGGPSLRYADYDGAGNRYYCAGEPEPSYNAATEPRPIRVANCGQHLPHQFAQN